MAAKVVTGAEELLAIDMLDRWVDRSAGPSWRTTVGASASINPHKNVSIRTIALRRTNQLAVRLDMASTLRVEFLGHSFVLPTPL